MAIVSHFPYLSSLDSENPKGIWGWAKRTVDALNKWKLFNLMDIPITDKPYYVIRVTEDGLNFELAPEELGLAGRDLTGLANQIVRVKPTEDGYFLDKEVLHSLIGAALVAGDVVRVNATADGFIYDTEVMNSLRGISLAGKSGKAVIVNATENGYTIAP